MKDKTKGVTVKCLAKASEIFKAVSQRAFQANKQLSKDLTDVPLRPSMLPVGILRIVRSLVPQQPHVAGGGGLRYRWTCF